MVVAILLLLHIKKIIASIKIYRGILMERYKGKNAIWLILVFVFYNLLPIGIYFLTDDKENLYNNWWLLIWVFYYSFNIIWIPVLIRNRVELY